MTDSSTNLVQFDMIFKRSGKVEVAESPKDHRICLVRRGIDEVADNTVFLEDLIGNTASVCPSQNPDKEKCVENSIENQDINKRGDVKAESVSICADFPNGSNTIQSSTGETVKTDIEQEVQLGGVEVDIESTGEKSEELKETVVETVQQVEDTTITPVQKPEITVQNEGIGVDIPCINPDIGVIEEVKSIETNIQNKPTDVTPKENNEKGVVNSSNTTFEPSMTMNNASHKVDKKEKDLSIKSVKSPVAEKVKGDNISNISDKKATKVKTKRFGFFSKKLDVEPVKVPVKQSVLTHDKETKSELSPEVLDILVKINKEYNR